MKFSTSLLALLALLPAVQAGKVAGDSCSEDSECDSNLCSSQILGQCIESREKCVIRNLPYIREETADEAAALRAFLDQFKPCGWYEAECPKITYKYSPGSGYEDGEYGDSEVIERNVAYAAYDNAVWNAEDGQEMVKGVSYITQFDIGISSSVVDRAEDGPLYKALIAQTGNRFGSFIDKDQDNFRGDASENLKTALEGHPETCLEYPTLIPAGGSWSSLDWGAIPLEFDGPEGPSDYNCMGKCGAGCHLSGKGHGYGRNCMKHDVCSAFKSALQGQPAKGFCMDVDCGDEAAQTVMNCWEKKRWSPDEPIQCPDFDGPEDDEFRVTVSFGSQAVNNKGACAYLYSGWGKEQGLPTALKDDGESCQDWSTCKSLRCDWKRWRKQCIARLDDDEGCNENNDCFSNKCESNVCQAMP